MLKRVTAITGDLNEESEGFFLAAVRGLSERADRSAAIGMVLILGDLSEQDGEITVNGCAPAKDCI